MAGWDEKPVAVVGARGGGVRDKATGTISCRHLKDACQAVTWNIADANLADDACAWSLGQPGRNRHAYEGPGQHQSSECGCSGGPHLASVARQACCYRPAQVAGALSRICTRVAITIPPARLSPNMK